MTVNPLNMPVSKSRIGRYQRLGRWLCLAWLMLMFETCIAADSIAATKAGKVRGIHKDGIHIFKGIRCGASTEGRRFMPPMPPKHWEGVRDAQEYGNESPQRDRKFNTSLLSSWWNQLPASEDCLFLNVWTPALRDGTKRPVMVWFHGGGYSTLSGSMHGLDGSRLSKKGDVVVITLNHRLNVFGYLYLAGLSQDPDLADSGNIGNLDLILALQWVKENITEFGGDPDNVLIFGESGGGRKVSCLMAMPAAKGLFHKAAIQSGSDLHRQTPEAAKKIAIKFFKAVGLETNQVNELRHLPMAKLVDGLNLLKTDTQFLPGPVVDGRNLTRHPFHADAPPTLAEVPLLVGTVKDETTALNGGSKPELFHLTWDSLPKAVKPFTQNLDETMFIQSLRNLYPQESPSDLFFTISTWQRYRNSALIQASFKWQQFVSTPGAAPAYLYELVWETPVEGGKWKAPHTLDIPFVFDNVDKSESLTGSGEEQQMIANQMSNAWIQFARTGNPGWPGYNPEYRPVMVFDVESKWVKDYKSQERELLSKLPKR